MRNRVVWLTVFLLIGFFGLSSSHAQEVVDLLPNGSFETGNAGPWNIYGDITSEVVTECVDAAVPEDPIEGDYCLHLVVPAAGAGPHESGMSDGSYIFERGKKYTFSAFIKCKSGTLEFRMKPEHSAPPWEAYGDQVFTATEEWQEFYVTTPVFTEDVTPASPSFHLAFAPGDFWMDGIRLYEGDYVEPAFSSMKARNPNPEDGTRLLQTWANLSWQPGSAATSHDAYIGEDYDDVLAGTGDTFQGNQSDVYLIVGFPGYPYPDGLVYGTTYYWRIDEVDELNPESPWVGDVWSFMVPSKSAFNPVPADGAKFIAADTELSWAGGFNSILHHVYFGDNYDEVDAGTGSTSKGVAGVPSFSPGALEQGKTYYWRIDEFDGLETHKGNVWAFTTAGTGGGIRADYYKGMNFETPALTRTDPQVNFNWGDPGGPDPSLGDDNFSVRWTGEVEAVFTETYTFYPRTDDGVRLFVDGQLLVDNWVNRSATEDRGTIDLIAGNTYSLVMEYYEDGGGASAELRWSSPRTPKQIIPQAALALPVKASSPTPRGGSVDVKQTIDLSWGQGDFAASHEVYFGIDEEAVRNATKASAEYKGTKALDDESYDPGKLDWAATYHWRVDEINPANPDSPWIGNVWSFTTADFLIIDDFESYDAAENQIWYSWHDGLGYGTPDVQPYLAGNGTGAAVGDETTPSFTEETTVHGGGQSMPMTYDNNKQGYSKYSETELTLTEPRDWTDGNVSQLTLWFRGFPGSVGNAAEPLYVAVSNSAGQPAVVAHDNPNAAQIDTWTKWVIPLQDIADQGINLANVDRIAFGLGTRGNTTVPGGSGKMLFDDILLERSVVTVVNLLPNGGFEDGNAGPWNIYGDVTFEVVTECVDGVVPEGPIEGDYCLHLVVPAAGVGPHEIGMSDGSHIFEQGKKYTFSCFIKCKSGTLDFRMKPEHVAPPWEGYNDQVFTATEEWQEFYVTTDVFAEDVVPASPSFHLAFEAGDFWMDNVRFYEGDYVPPE